MRGKGNSMKWTTAQQQTIDTRDKNILVSAAAGSGKTAVLIERIKQLMLGDKVDIDRFLITTFTDAASAEMKERLEKAIKDEFNAGGADRKFLKKQLMLLPSANISTFHTFALEVMRRFFYLTDLEPGFKIEDDVESSMMIKEAADGLFDRRFNEEYEDFTSFLKKYSDEKSEDQIKTLIIDTYKEMRSIPDYFKWAYEHNELLAADSPVEALGLKDHIRQECLKGLVMGLERFNAIAEILSDSGMEESLQLCREHLVFIQQHIEKVEEYDFEAYKFICDGRKNRFQCIAKKEKSEQNQETIMVVERLVGEGKALFKYAKDKGYFDRSFYDYDNELKSQYDDTKYLIGLMEELEAIYSSMKHEKNVVDFDDVMHYALNILRDEKAAAEYKKKFKYIFIDEYQDSNLLQENIAGSIASGNNMFMVGDVKQSIYKFRLAEPEIFKRKYESFANESETDSIKIDLNSNFRSKRNVTEFVNGIFREVMEGYDANAELHCEAPEEYPGMPPQLHILEKIDDDGLIIEDKAAEAHYVAGLVKDCIGKEIYDVKTGAVRTVEYKDIAILANTNEMVSEIERTLNDEDIPAIGGFQGNYYESVEIQVFINLLKIIDNTSQDIPLISVMRCPVFGFTLTELAEIRIFDSEGDYHVAAKHYAEAGPDDELRNKINDFYNKIGFWKELKDSVSLEELIRILLYDTGYYDYCSGLPVGKQRVLNLHRLLEKAGEFERKHYTGLYGFLSYIKALNENKRPPKEVNVLGEGENVVNVMTIHKSKGLEFPVVILTEAGKGLGSRKGSSLVSMHKEFAIGLSLVDLESRTRMKTILQTVIKSKKDSEAFEEKIRLLYVALTRAKDWCIVTGLPSKIEDVRVAADEAKNYLGVIYSTMFSFNEDGIIYGKAGIDVSIPQRGLSKERAADIFEKSRAQDPAERPEVIDKVLSFEYPYPELNEVKSKYSVTELNKQDGAEPGRTDVSEAREMFLAKPEFTQEKRGLDAAEIGTVMHLVMERIDFATAMQKGAPYILQRVEEMLADGEISEEERAVIDVENAAAFFKDSVGKRAACALHLEKEREFILQKDVKGVPAIVQGIIDCYFEEEDGLVLVDYKNSTVGDKSREEVIIDRYRKQIELYKEALEAAEGKPVKEAYLYLFEQNKFVEVRS